MASTPEKQSSFAHTTGPMIPRVYRVRRMVRETHDIFTIALAPENRAALQPFAPGQFNMLYVFGVGEVPISISGDPLNHEVLAHTVRPAGAVTKALWKLGRSGSLGVRGPFGSHWPVDEAAGSDVIIVAGGIGLAALRPAVYKVLSQREKYGKVVILYGTRTPDDILFRAELEQWRSRFDLQVAVTVDRAVGGWRGDVGVVTNLIGKATFDPPNTIAMVCGPEVMMRFTSLELLKRGLAPESIFISIERNMKCAVGFCGHCQYGPNFICKDGPVFPFDRIRSLFSLREV